MQSGVIMIISISIYKAVRVRNGEPGGIEGKYEQNNKSAVHSDVGGHSFRLRLAGDTGGQYCGLRRALGEHCGGSGGDI